jgi:hypothetical protein
MDLTDPNARSLPIAIQLIGTVGDEFLAGAMGKTFYGGIDPIADALLGDLPRVLRQHVDECVEGELTTPDQVLRSLAHSMRTTLHVSKISEVTEVKLATAPGVALAEALAARFNEEVEKPIQEVLREVTNVPNGPKTHRGRPPEDWLGEPTHPLTEPYQIWALERLRAQTGRISSH